MTASHTPEADPHQTRIGCPDCGWAQLLDEDLHEGHVAALIAWHQQNPDQGIDHLAAADIHNGLGIPEYVRWVGDGNGGLALGDERTGQAAWFNHECLAIMNSVRSTRGLTRAVQRTASRLKISGAQATDTIVHLALLLYRKGLLKPAPVDGDRPGV
ncbi:hypothetical protein ABZ249_12005 [Nocardiopsis sp. NPDC006139]|uniref:hypothetical protein n=1 Tax=Nocardiopsis sp. NPDC006139 TaxID=3154578 RepID=UPI0033AD8A2A